MTPELRSHLQALGRDLSPEMMGGTQAIMAARHPGLGPETKVERDLAYGADERHRLDIFRREGTAHAPVLVFVHGGGFVMGDKRSPQGHPFYDNVGDFAAAAGFVGVTITYRLAPAHTWPAGPEDLAEVVGWLHDNIAAHGGDPDRIYLSGQSAGAVHVASYVAHARFHANGRCGVAGAIMISGIYDVAAADANPFHKAYYGEDASSYAAASTVEGLIESEVPLLLSVSEFDPVDFQRQAAAFVGAYGSARSAYPRMLYMSGHNHLSPALGLGGPDDRLGPEIADFIRATAPVQRLQGD